MLEIVTFSANSLLSMKRGYNITTKKASNSEVCRDSPPPKKAKVTKSMGKHIFIVFIDRQDVLLTHAVPQDQTMNSTYYTRVKKYFLAALLASSQYCV